MTYRDLAAVGKARLQARARLAIDHSHVVAGFGKVPGGRGADHSGTEDEDFHARLSEQVTAQAAIRWIAASPLPLSCYLRDCGASCGAMPLRWTSPWPGFVALQTATCCAVLAA